MDLKNRQSFQEGIWNVEIRNLNAVGKTRNGTSISNRFIRYAAGQRGYGAEIVLWEFNHSLSYLCEVRIIGDSGYYFGYYAVRSRWTEVATLGNYFKEEFEQGRFDYSSLEPESRFVA